MRRRAAFLVAVAALAAAGGWYGHQMLPGDHASSAAPFRTLAPEKSELAQPAVIVDASAQQASGIKVAPLTRYSGPLQQIAYATVFDLKPLFDLHNSYATARANRDAAKVQADTSATQYRRQLSLYKNSQAASQKTMQDAEVAMKNDEAKLKATDVTLSDVAANAQEQLGNVLSAAVTETSSELFRKLAQGKESILLVSFSPGAASSPPPVVTVDGPRQNTISAHKLSVAPQADPSVQGDTYLYLSSKPLPLGTRTIARARSGDNSGKDVFVPESALLWYGGQQWLYAQKNKNHFIRRPIGSAIPVSKGLVVNKGFKAGELVVVQGAQLLLSQELKPKNIATQCKDPPECDD